jgi:D-galactarolactone cycloisomerase
MMADGNAGYTFPRAIEMGKILERLGFIWFEEPVHQREGYAGYETLRASLDIALAAGEILESRSAAIAFLARGCADIVQPEPVICGGVAETLWIADLAGVHSIAAMPHTSNNAIGIAAGLQALACLPDPNRSPASDELYLEFGMDDNPHRTGLLSSGLTFDNGWVTVPTGPGLGVEVDEAYLQKHAVETRTIDGTGARTG